MRGVVIGLLIVAVGSLLNSISGKVGMPILSPIGFWITVIGGITIIVSGLCSTEAKNRDEDEN